MTTRPFFIADDLVPNQTRHQRLEIHADIGGTYSRFRLVLARQPLTNQALAEQRYTNSDFDRFTQVLDEFIKRHEVDTHACDFVAAIAGPIAGSTERQRCNLTNIDWTIDAANLQRQYGFSHALLLNDLESAAFGVLSEPLTHTVINSGQMADEGVALVVGIGTGLGMAYAFRHADTLSVFASEGGHIAFSPRNSILTQISQQLSPDNQPLSYEDLLSGSGIEDIYKTLQPNTQPLDAASISALAHQGHPLAEQTLVIFADLCAAYLANLALAFRPTMGIHLIGGVTAKNSQWLQGRHFVEAFTRHQHMTHLLEKTTVRLYEQQDFGLKGAAIALNTLNGGGSHD